MALPETSERWWRYQPRRVPQQLQLRKAMARREEKRPKSLQEQAEEILARPGVVTPFGLRNVTADEARIVAQYRMQEAEAGPRPQPKVVSPGQALLNVLDPAIRGVEAIAETGLAASQVATGGKLPIPGIPGLRVPITAGGKEQALARSRESLREIGQAVRGERGFTETVGGLAERQRARPFVEQLGAGAVFDPLNLLPGVGWGPEIVLGLKALKGASREAVEAAIRNAPKTAEGIRAALNSVGDRIPDVKRILSGEGGFAKLGGEGGDALQRAKRLAANETMRAHRGPVVSPISAEDLAFVKTELSQAAQAGDKEAGLLLEKLPTTPPPKPVAPVVEGAEPFRPATLEQALASERRYKVAEDKDEILGTLRRAVEGLKTLEGAVPRQPRVITRQKRFIEQMERKAEAILAGRFTDEESAMGVIQTRVYSKYGTYPPVSTKPVPAAPKRQPRPRGEMPPIRQETAAGVPSRQVIAKEPWEMTEAEYREALRGVAGRGNMPIAAIWPKDATGQPLTIRQVHQQVIAENLARGKPVPANVLADYPDLVTKPLPTVAEQVAPPRGGMVPSRPAEAAGDVQRWIDSGNTRPVAETLAQLDSMGLIVRVEGHSKPGGIIPFSVRFKDGTFATNATSLKAKLHAEAPGGVVRKEAVEDLAAAPSPAAWATGESRPFAFDPNSTANQGRFRLLPPKKDGKYITRQGRERGVSYIVDTETNAIQALRFNKAQFTETKAAEWWEANKARFRFAGQAAEEAAPAPGRTPRVRRTPPPRVGAPEAALVEAAGVVTPSPAAAAPAGPPRKPPTARGGGGVTPAGPDIPSYVEPPMMGKNVLGMKPIQAGLSKTEEIANIARRLVSKVRIRTVEANPLVSAAFKERARVKSVIDSQSGRLGAVNGARLTRVFQPDKTGRISSLAGIDSTIPGAPTIQDVAARLPTYWDLLTQAQRDALLAVRGDVTPYRALLNEVGVEVPTRADIMEGGFYLPRGRADVEGADLPLKVGAGLGRGPKKGFERPAVFDSQAVGIEAGYQYSPVGDTLTAYARDAGNRSIDAHVTNFFKSAVDETGLPIGQTPKMRLMEQSPEIAQKMTSLKASLARLKQYTDNLSKRQLEVIDLWSTDPSFDDLDVLLEGLSTMRGGTPSRVLRELRLELTKGKAEIAALRPAYSKALRKAQVTPREQGTVGLPGLQGTTFPDEIANAANVILRGEGQPTGLFSMPIRIANAFNNLYRGVRATLDNSALGIQGLLGAADDPVAYGKAVGVNIRAWGPGGDAALGRFIEHFDTAATAAGRLTSDDWARGGLRIGGAQTEFQLGGGFFPALAKAPVIRQANRAFGYLGDALRLGWGDDMLEDELRRGKTLQQLWDAGDVERIARVANNMTGWAEGKAFGSMGDLLLFAPRFLQSRLETVVKAGMSVRLGATIEQRAARRSLLKMMGYGAVLTVAANEMLGNDTDFRPLVWDARRKQYTYNPNFMRVRFMGRDYSIYGTWDSLARAITVTAMGRPQEALRGLGSGIVADAWDIIGDRDWYGNRVRDTPLHFAQWIIRAHLPFAAEEVPPIIAGGVSAIREGKPGEILGTALVAAGEVIGAKSSPITRLEAIGDATPEYNAYFAIPTKGWDLKSGQLSREEYREKHPDVDAMLFITGAVSSLIARKGMLGGTYSPSADAALALIRENNINPDDIRAIKARKERVAAYKKAGLEPPESRGVDRLIRLLEQPPLSTKQRPVPTQLPTPTPTPSGGLTEEQMRWWIEQGLPMEFPTPTSVPVGAR